MAYFTKIQIKQSSSFSLLKVFIVLLLMSFITSCLDGGDTSNDSPLSSAKTQILVSSSAIFLSEVEGQYQLVALVVDARGVALTEQPAFTWTSDDVAVVSVNANGLLTATAFGKASVQVAAEGMSKTVLVEISNQMTTLSGHVRYADKEYQASGFTGRANYHKAVRFAKVDLLTEESNTVLQTTYTDDAGGFAFTGVFSSLHSVVVYAKTNSTVGLNLRVEDRSRSIYAVSKVVNLSDLNNFLVDIPLTNQAAGAFNILDVFTNAAQFTLATSDATSVSLAAFWQPGNDDGSYYCTGSDSTYCRQGAGVYVFNKPGADTDEFDDDVLYHEFGHYFVDAISRDDSFGGCHLLSSKDLDLRLAWSEGWGNFFPVAVKSWLVSTDQFHLLSHDEGAPVTGYLDTYGNTQQIYINLTALSQTRYSSAGNEMAVSKILWQLSERFGVAAIVDVLENYLPGVSTPVNLESFWDGWLVEHTPTTEERIELESYFSERLIYYQEDRYESDNVINAQRKATLGQSETHYLYSDSIATDIDVVAFDVIKGQQYRVKTSQLTSGADTHLRITDSSNAQVIVNDDADSAAYYSYDSSCGASRVRNNGTALSSAVTFIASSTGTYYAEIRTTTDAEPYLSAGRYGTYDLTISQTP